MKLWSFVQKTVGYIKPILSQIWDYIFPQAKHERNLKARSSRINLLVDKMLAIANLYEMSAEPHNLLAQYLNHAPKDKALMQACSKRLRNLQRYRINQFVPSEYDLFVTAVSTLKQTQGYSMQRFIETCPVKGVIEELELQTQRLERAHSRFNVYKERFEQSDKVHRITSRKSV